MVEPQPSKLMARVRFPLPAPDSAFWPGKVTIWLVQKGFAHIAQSVEHFLGKEEVTGSNPVMSSISTRPGYAVPGFPVSGVRKVVRLLGAWAGVFFRGAQRCVRES